nr:reverse transcriptase [Tanacetum cinerariifolium]
MYDWERPRKWKKWLSLAELWKKCFQGEWSDKSVIDEAHEAVYVQSPLVHVPYFGGLSKVDALDKTLEAREQAIQMLKFHLNRTQNRMKLQADKRKSDRVLELKLCKGSPLLSQILDLPSCNKEGLMEPELVALLDRKMVKRNNAVVVYGLVQWANGSKEDATWELLEELMELYMLNRQHGCMILESIENGPLIWPSIEENGVTRPKKYYELSPTEAIQADCDIKATNIIIQGLPSEVYALVSNHKVAKELWERIQLLMQGTSLTKHEKECKLYDESDKFAYKKEETLREFYLRFSLLLYDMNIYNMKLEQFQVNTKFLNTLLPEWSKFMTDVKLVWDLHITNIDQLHAYLGQHEFHANEKGDDPIDAINHMMSFLTVVVPSRNNSGKQKTVICYNCKREGHMSKQCTKPKRKRDDSWFKDKVLLVQAQANGQILHEEELAFLSDPGMQKLKPHRLSSPTMLLIKPMI